MRAGRREDPQASFFDFGQLTWNLGSHSFPLKVLIIVLAFFLYLRNLGRINKIIVQMCELFVGKNAV